MKNVFIITLMLVLNNSCISQLEPLSSFKNKELGDFTTFKIYGKKFKTNFSDLFLSKKDTVFKNESDDLIYFMIYKKKYLFASYYPKSQSMLAIGFELRSLNKLEVIKLDNPATKWLFQFDKKAALKSIKSFSEKDGTIIFNETEKIAPVYR